VDRGETWAQLFEDVTIYAGTSGFGVFSAEPMPDRPDLRKASPRIPTRVVGDRR
jgi:hypothetical protein